MKTYIKNAFIGLDQFANTILLGDPDETISSRAWRNSQEERNYFWRFARWFIDQLFFWQIDHCLNSYKSELAGKQLPELLLYLYDQNEISDLCPEYKRVLADFIVDNDEMCINHLSK